MKEITLNMPIFGNNVTATATEEETSFSKAEKAKGVFTAHLPGYTSPSLNDDSVSAYKLEVEKNQDALKVDDLDFRLHYDWNPLSQDIASTLVEDLRETAEKRYHTKDIMIRLDLDNPTCYVGLSKSNNNSTDDSTAPLEDIPKAPTTHHHNKPTPSATPTAKPKMTVNNENLIRRYYQQMIARITAEYEDKIKKLKDKLLKQRHSYETKLKEQKKHYELQLQQKQQPKLALPKSNQRIVDWVQYNWKVLEPTFKQYALAMYSSQNERQHGGEDGKGDKFEADKYKQQAQDIMTMSFNDFFKHAKQKSTNAQPTKDNQKPKDEELDK